MSVCVERARSRLPFSSRWSRQSAAARPCATAHASSVRGRFDSACGHIHTQIHRHPFQITDKLRHPGRETAARKRERSDGREAEESGCTHLKLSRVHLQRALAAGLAGADLGKDGGDEVGELHRAEVELGALCGSEGLCGGIESGGCVSTEWTSWDEEWAWRRRGSGECDRRGELSSGAQQRALQSTVLQSSMC